MGYYGKLPIVLLSELAAGREDSNNCRIARYLLGRLDCLEGVSVEKLAAECFVPKATVSRFCRDIGLEDFSELRDLLRQTEKTFTLYGEGLPTERLLTFQSEQDFVSHPYQLMLAASLIGQPVGIVHGDINESNLIRENHSLRYILDWQRPMLAPLALEQALALRLAGYQDEDKDWDNFALACHILWYSWSYVHVLPIESVQQIACELITELSNRIDPGGT